MSDKDQTPEAPEAPSQNYLPPVEERKLEEKIPGLQLTWADLEAMELEGEDHEAEFVRAARQAKEQYRGAHFIYLAGRPFIHRTINRRELASLRTKVAEISTAKSDDVPSNMDPQQFQAQLMKDSLEEEMVMACSIFPAYNRLTVKEEDAGIITSLHDAIVQASGFNQNSAPIRL
jgi:hypothetical protein